MSVGSDRAESVCEELCGLDKKEWEQFDIRVTVTV